MDNKKLIQGKIKKSICVEKTILKNLVLIDKIVNIIVAAYRNGGKVIVFGNGGSAAQAQHLAAEFMGKFYLERKPLPAISLTVDTSILTAIGNDYSFDDVFSRQIEGLGNTGDIAIGISTSGNSRNVIKAVKKAKEKKMATIVLTGKGGGKLIKYADYCLAIASDDTPRIQEAHVLVAHIICELVEKNIFVDKRR